MVEGPFSRLIFLSLATEEADKAFTKSFVLRCFCVNIQAVADFWVNLNDLEIEAAECQILFAKTS